MITLESEAGIEEAIELRAEIRNELAPSSEVTEAIETDAVVVDGINVNAEIQTVSVDSELIGTVTVTGQGDAKYSQDFSTASEVLVTHNLNKYPAVSVIDSSNQEVIAPVEYINTLMLRVRFGAPFSGKVICN